MDTIHSILSGLKHDGLSSEAEEDVRMHYTEIITYLTSLSKHPGLDVVFDFQMSVYPTNQRPLAWATDEISEISVVQEDERGTVREPQAPGAEVLANIERARKEDIEAVEARWKREMEGLRDQLRAAEAGCEKKCHDANRRGYAMGYAFADEKATKAFEAMRADLQRLTEENKKLERRVAEESHWCKDANLATRTAEMHAQMLRTDVAQLQMENEGLKKQLVDKEDMVTRQAETTETLHKHLHDAAEEAAVKATADRLEIMRELIARGAAENKELREQIEEDKQMVQRHLKEIAKEHAVMTAWEKKEIERLTAENKMLRTDVAELKKENEGLRKLVFPSLNLEAASSGVKVEPELAPKFPQVVQASPQLVAALKAEKTWNDGIDVCYALTKKDYEDMMKAKGPLPSVEVVEDDVDLELLKKMVGDAPLPPSPPSPLVEEEGEMPDQLASCGAPGCYDCPVAEPKPKPKYNHHFWPSPTTKRFAKHIAKYAGKDPKAIKTHEDALNFIAKRAKISVETLLGYSIKQYQSTFEPWSLAGDPWSLPNSHYFQI